MNRNLLIWLMFFIIVLNILMLITTSHYIWVNADLFTYHEKNITMKLIFLYYLGFYHLKIIGFIVTDCH